MKSSVLKNARKRMAFNKQRHDDKELSRRHFPVCVICGSGISWEHGGIECQNCGALFCCSSSCIPQSYCAEDVGYSRLIPFCPLCEDSKQEGSK